MLISSATNQLIVAEAGTTQEIVTDPVSIASHDRASAIFTIHLLLGPGPPLLTYISQVSNDGATWVDAGPTASASATGTGPIVVSIVTGAQLRVRFQLAVGAGAGVGSALFHLTMKLRKSRRHQSQNRSRGNCSGCSDVSVHLDATSVSDSSPRYAATPGSGAATSGVGTVGLNRGPGAVPSVPPPLAPTTTVRAAVPAGAVAPNSRWPQGPTHGMPREPQRFTDEERLSAWMEEMSHLYPWGIPGFEFDKGPGVSLAGAYATGQTLSGIPAIDMSRGPGFAKAPGAGAVALERVGSSSPEAGAVLVPGAATSPMAVSSAFLQKPGTNPAPPKNLTNPKPQTNPTNPKDPTFLSTSAAE